MTETNKRNLINIKKIKFDAKGLVPAIVVDTNTKRVLTLAYMNEESLKISIEKKLTCFYSRSRQELWLKGETSGNYQHIVSITADCDRDALVIEVQPDGPACHLGTWSCFDYPLLCENSADAAVSTVGDKTADDGDEAVSGNADFSYEGLMNLIEGRKTEKKEGSYTSYLFDKGLDKILKKIGEESTEVIIAAKAEDKAETVYEIADLAYHVMVLMAQAGITLDEIAGELASRHVIDKKVKQEKMV